MPSSWAELIKDVLDAAADVSGALTSIPTEHHKIHQGLAWRAVHELDSLASGATSKFLIRVPAGVSPHLRSYRVNSTGNPVLIRLYEGATVTVVGTTVTPRNCKRSVSDTDGVLIYTGATATADGTLLESSRVVGDRHAGSSDDPTIEEWNLKPSTDYLITVKNESNGSVNVILNLFWYEPS